MSARAVLQDVEVLEDRVGRPAIPLGDPAPRDIGLEHLDPARVAVQVPRPAQPDVVVERAGVVLGQDDDVGDVRVDAVRQREVDDPVLAPERDRRLGPDRGQDREALTLAAGQDHRHRPLHAQVLVRRLTIGRTRSLGDAAGPEPPGPMLALRSRRSDVRRVNIRWPSVNIVASDAGGRVRPPPLAARPAQTNRRGFTHTSWNSTAQWRCGPVEFPVTPM